MMTMMDKVLEFKMERIDITIEYQKVVTSTLEFYSRFKITPNISFPTSIFYSSFLSPVEGKDNGDWSIHMDKVAFNFSKGVSEERQASNLEKLDRLWVWLLISYEFLSLKPTNPTPEKIESLLMSIPSFGLIGKIQFKEV